MKRRKKLEINSVYHGNCLHLMKRIPNKSIDMILCDLPYGTTNCKWDIIIPFDKLWKQYKRIIKDRCCIALFGQEPFSSLLRTGNIEWFKYDWIWNKLTGTNFVGAHLKPMPQHEIISIFSNGTVSNGSNSLMYYFPQNLIKVNKIVRRNPKRSRKNKLQGNSYERNSHKKNLFQEFINYPCSILEFKKEKKYIHETQKPVDLCRYLIKTYTKENDLVLDNCMGSGTTCVAAKETGRNYIGIEKDKEIFEIAKERIQKANKPIEKQNWWNNDNLRRNKKTI